MSEPNTEPEAPKIIVDSDWKSEAQAEKQRLLQDEAQQKQSHADPKDKPLSPFEELLRMLVTQAMLYMGAFPDPQTGQSVVSIELAQVYIDMLSWLDEKTKGNLSKEDAALLSKTTNELRLEFIEMSKAVAKAIKEGRISPAKGRPTSPAAPGPITP
ncbi:MAG: DUF1844 domain-containing protein [Planctomycetes bacterium]|nr:DUF1844 domain-containing protein [Planctomycetota bacterium]MCH9058181.1 DUF1844 domain-containing protein [Planctomycetota bacterium]